MNEIIQNSNTERRYCYPVIPSVKKTILNKKGLLKNSSKDQPILMKRDSSRIFTVPEEEEFESSHYSAHFSSFSTVSTEVCNSPTKQKDECKIDYSKYTVPTTPSICSTPLKDVNRVLHGTVVSICNTFEETGELLEIAVQPETLRENTDAIPDIVKEAFRYKHLNKFKNIVANEKVVKFRNNRRSLSLSDIKDYDKDASQGETCSKNVPSTIADSFYPVFQDDGHPVSQSLYNQYISTHYERICHTPEIFCSAIDPPSRLLELRNESINFIEYDTSSEDCIKIKKSNTSDVKLANTSKQEVNRRSMSLPLKPLNILDNEEQRKSISEYDNASEIQPFRKLDGLQLTPLMSRLSIMADEETHDFHSRETRPSDFRESSHLFVTEYFTIKDKLEAIHNESTIVDAEIRELIAARQDSNFLQKTELFLCGHQNMVLVLLMEHGTCSNPELIHFLWRTCVKNLEKLEIRLQKCLDPLPVIENKELYSILTVDCEWDTVHRSGLWGVTELDIVSTLHKRFINGNNLTEVTIRTEDIVVHGNQCGKVEVYYQQSMTFNPSGGLPTPADLMGIVPLKAKRRVERDHEIIIL